MKKVNLLSRAEMRKVMGGYVEEEEDGLGGSCCAHYNIGCPDIQDWYCGLTKAEAKAKANEMAQDGTEGGASWCCTGCPVH